MIKLDINDALKFVDSEKFAQFYDKAQTQYEVLINGTGKGNDFLGWLDLPNKSKNEVYDIQSIAERMQWLDCVIIIGIGGSYLGAKAAIEALKPQFKKTKTEIIFAGHTLSANYYQQLCDYVKDKDFGIVVISKSGTTTEPAIAFRLLFQLLQAKGNKQKLRDRVVIITDKEKGALRRLCNEFNFGEKADCQFDSFVIDDNVGGRFSVLSAVGLLPIAIAGFNVPQLLDGAINSKKDTNRLKDQICKYAAIRNLLYSNGKYIELLVNYDLRFNYFAEWWKQLFGESEGKNGKGIFPASVSYTTDLHSLGQYVQQGERHLFETVLQIALPDKENDMLVPHDADNYDKLNYLQGRGLDEINAIAAQATRTAHVSGGVPNISITVDKLDAINLGELFYFFEMACGVSAYMLGVNPFNQPGVEDYKKEMFKLLGKK